jgi:hypothetical protein
MHVSPIHKRGDNKFLEGYPHEGCNIHHIKTSNLRNVHWLMQQIHALKKYNKSVMTYLDFLAFLLM